MVHINLLAVEMSPAKPLFFLQLHVSTELPATIICWAPKNKYRHDMTKRNKRKQEDGPLQVAALLCILVGIAQLAAKYYGVLEFFWGYISGIICIATGVTLFAFDKAPNETLGILKAFLNFLIRIAKGLIDFVKSR